LIYKHTQGKLGGEFSSSSEVTWGFITVAPSNAVLEPILSSNDSLLLGIAPDKVECMGSPRAPLTSSRGTWFQRFRVHTVMKRSWKVMEYEICIPGLEKSGKLEKVVWVMEKSWNFRFFS